MYSDEQFQNPILKVSIQSRHIIVDRLTENMKKAARIPEIDFNAYLHYAPVNHRKPVISNGVDHKWRGIRCQVLARAKGPGPRNILVKTVYGLVVVPRGNVRLLDMKESYENA